MKKQFLVIIMLIAVLFSLIGCQSNSKYEENKSDFYPLYANRSTAGRLYGNHNSLIYANVFDNSKLYRYDIDTNTKSLMTEDVHRVQFISEFENKLYFSAFSAVDAGGRSNIYKIDINGENLKLILENAKAPLIHEGYMYYHDALDDFAYGIYRMDLDTGEIQELIPKSYECFAMTINIVDDFLYAYGLTDIFELNLNTMELDNITNGIYPHGIGKLQYSNGYLYYYTYGPNSAIMRYHIENKTHETVCIYNDGDFWYDVLLVNGNHIVFTGRQMQALRPDQDESEMIVGTYIYNMETTETKQVSRTSLGPTCYIYDTKIVALQTFADTGMDRIIIMDYNGNILNDYPAMQE